MTRSEAKKPDEVAEATETNTETNTGASDAPEIFAMSDVMRYNATAQDDRFPVREVFFDAGAGVLRYVALDVGGWFDRREVIVSADLMAAPQESDRQWPVEISPSAIEAAPEWSDPRMMERMPAGAMPPIMLGPFGGHFAGIIAQDQIEPRDGEDLRGNLKVDGFERFNEWVGLPVFGQSGEVGTLVDILFEPETGSLSHLVIDTGAFLAARQMVVPYDLLRHRAEGGTHVVMNVTEKLLREAPPLEHFDKVNRSWVDTLRAYYQLSPRL
jgi:hypothetical protein